MIPSVTRDHVPRAFARAMVELHGTAGADWLARLPAILSECAQRWRLRLGAAFTPLTYNYVLPALRSDGTEVVLKVGFPGRELITEIAALRSFAGRGCAALLESDPDVGALLLERLRPGTPLAGVPDDAAANSAAAGVMRTLWKPPPPDHSFPSVADWGAGFSRLRRRFDGGAGPLPPALVDEAETLFRDLTDSASGAVLLHGDLHHENILSSGRVPWLAIDPKGLIGEPAYEIGALLRNRVPRTDGARGMLGRRVDQLSEELGIDRERARGWGVAQGVLSAWWSIEDHGRGWEDAIACAEILRTS